MTLVSDIIQRAFRRGQIIPIGTTPSTVEQTEALTILNSIIVSSLGNEVGSELSPLNIGGTYDQSALCSFCVPENARLILNLSGAVTLKLHPQPYDGQRLAVADAAGNLGTYNLTLDGNGRQVEYAPTITYATDGLTRQWIYCDDVATWVPYGDLGLTDTMPLDEAFDMYFVNMLAAELNPQNGVTTAPEVVASMRRAQQQIQARYRRPRNRQDMPSRLLNSRRGSFGLTQSDFNAGRTFR